MKALVIFICLLVGCSSHILNKRSLLGGRQSHGHGHGHHGHHQANHRQNHRGRQAFGRRGGRDGDSSHHHDDNEARAAPTGYLPAADDYEYDDNLAGYNGEGGAEGRGQAQYNNDEQGQYGDDEYDYADGSGSGEPAASDVAKSADDAYGAPRDGAASNIDTSYAAPDGAGDGYAAPGDEEAAAREADDEYGAPSSADDEYGAPGQGQYDSGFPFSIVEGRQGGEGGEGSGAGDAGYDEDATKICPGGSLDACVAVCPGITAKVYGACVHGCAERCSEG